MYIRMPKKRSRPLPNQLPNARGYGWLVHNTKSVHIALAMCIRYLFAKDLRTKVILGTLIHLQRRDISGYTKTRKYTSLREKDSIFCPTKDLYLHFSSQQKEGNKWHSLDDLFPPLLLSNPILCVSQEVNGPSFHFSLFYFFVHILLLLPSNQPSSPRKERSLIQFPKNWLFLLSWCHVSRGKKKARTRYIFHALCHFFSLWPPSSLQLFFSRSLNNKKSEKCISSPGEGFSFFGIMLIEFLWQPWAAFFG